MVPGKLVMTWVLGMVLLFDAFPASSLTDALEGFTGAHTRVTWIQEQGQGADTFSFGENFKLMGYDSRDGKGERPLLDEVGNLFLPILTPDGNKVVVSSRLRHEIYLVDFKRGGKKLLGQGVAVAVWEDPADETVWVYALAGDGPENKYFTTHPLIRFPLKKPDKREVVWNKTHLSWNNFNLSRDGKLAGGLFPWPYAGILLFEQGTWKQYGKGCWTALSPDNSGILWVFDGLHRNLNMVNPFTAQFWTTNINNAPGIGGFEVYHPRWSNHVRYLSMTGPYVEGEGGNKITGGGKKVEIYVGRFSPDLKSVEGWHQLTRNGLADFYPDVWIANGRDSNLASGGAVKDTPAAVAEQHAEWPVNREHLVYLWQDVLAENRSAENSLTGFFQFETTPKQRARFNRYLEMDLQASGFLGGWPAEKVVSAINQSGALGAELLFTPEGTGAESVGPILRLRQGDKDLLILTQRGKDLIAEVMAQGGSAGRMEIAGALHAQRPEHLFIVLKGREMEVYGNGRLLQRTELKQEVLPLPTDIQLIFGQPESSGKGIRGAISHVAFHAGAVPEKAIASSARLVTGALESRSAEEIVTLRGELVEVSKVPAPDSLGAYQRALVVNRYRVLGVEKGVYTQPEILVAQWAVLDRSVLPETAEFTVGRQARLQVEAFDKHPELEGERLMMDMFDPDLELQYQVRQ